MHLVGGCWSYTMDLQSVSNKMDLRGFSIMIYLVQMTIDRCTDGGRSVSLTGPYGVPKEMCSIVDVGSNLIDFVLLCFFVETNVSGGDRECRDYGEGEGKAWGFE